MDAICKKYGGKSVQKIALLKKLQHIASGEIKIWKLIIVYDFLVRIVVAIPIIILKEAEPNSKIGILILAIAKLIFGCILLVYFGACIIGAYKSLRENEHTLLTTIVGCCYVVTCALFYFGGIAAILTMR